MLNNLVKAFGLLRTDFSALKEEVSTLKTLRVVPKPGKDGVSPKVEDIVDAVLAKIPPAKNGVSPDPKAIVADVLALMPKPVPGRDAAPINVSDVAAVVLAKIEKPKDGVSPDVQAVAKAAAALIPKPKDGVSPSAEAVAREIPPPKNGKNGVSVTDVQLKNNDLFVFLDGKKKKAGRIKVPTPSAPFNPGHGGGGGLALSQIKPVAKNVVIVNAIEDFPTQDDTTITTQPDTQYFIGQNISYDKEIIMSNGSSITSIGPFFKGLTYTGTGTMFWGDATNWSIESIRINCANGTIFNQINGGTVQWANMQCLSCSDVGSFTGLAGPLSSFLLDNVAVLSVSNSGLQLAGDLNILSFIKFFQRTSSATFIGVDLGASIVNNLEFNNLDFDGPAGSVAISGLTGSGNVNADQVATVSDSSFIGSGMVALSGVSVLDVRWQFRDNSGVPDSVNDADAFLVGGAETITIATQGVFEEIGVPSAGGVSWASEIASRFTVGADGVITYIGERGICVQLTGTATVEKVGGGSDQLEIRFAKNWVPSQTGLSKSRAVTQNATPTSVPMSALTELVNGDNIRAIFANNSGVSDIIAEVTSISVRQ